MDLVQLTGLSASVCIGICLGLIGGGGSILTLPILVYLLHINPVTSSAYSLFIVGATALVGSVTYMRQKLVAYQVAFIFSLPSFLAVYVARQYLVPAIPTTIVVIGNTPITRNMVIMLLFGVLMLAASFSMIRSKGRETTRTLTSPLPKLTVNLPLIFCEGAIIGLLTGMVGAGGGFLIIPALVLLARLPMKVAIGTSLLIITLKSLIGFIGDLSHVPIDWSFLLPFTALSISGIFIGTYLSRFVSGTKLKKSFGCFVLVVSVYILTREAF